MKKKRSNPSTHTVIGRRTVVEAGRTDLKVMAKKLRREMPAPPPLDSKITPYRKPQEKRRSVATVPGAEPILPSGPKGKLKQASSLQTVEVRDTYRLRRKGGVLRLQQVSGHKRSLTKKRLRREGKL